MFLAGFKLEFQSVFSSKVITLIRLPTQKFWISGLQRKLFTVKSFLVVKNQNSDDVSAWIALNTVEYHWTIYRCTNRQCLLNNKDGRVLIHSNLFVFCGHWRDNADFNMQLSGVRLSTRLWRSARTYRWLSCAKLEAQTEILHLKQPAIVEVGFWAAVWFCVGSFMPTRHRWISHSTPFLHNHKRYRVWTSEPLRSPRWPLHF